MTRPVQASPRKGQLGGRFPNVSEWRATPVASSPRRCDGTGARIAQLGSVVVCVWCVLVVVWWWWLWWWVWWLRW